MISRRCAVRSRLGLVFSHLLQVFESRPGSGLERWPVEHLRNGRCLGMNVWVLVEGGENARGCRRNALTGGGDCLQRVLIRTPAGPSRNIWETCLARVES